MMVEEDPRRHNEAHALFVTDDELRRRVNPKIGRDRFRAIVKQLEGRGFPKKHAVFGGRYWPKVLRWLDQDSGIAAPGLPAHDVEDGPENFDNAPRRRRPK